MIPFISGAVGIAGALSLILVVLELFFDDNKKTNDWVACGIGIVITIIAVILFHFGIV